jgi:hypothetical protein
MIFVIGGGTGFSAVTPTVETLRVSDMVLSFAPNTTTAKFDIAAVYVPDNGIGAVTTPRGCRCRCPDNIAIDIDCNQIPCTLSAEAAPE